MVLGAISLGTLPDAVKNAMLLNALGAEGFRLAASDPILSDSATASYNDVKAAAARLFAVKGSEIRAIKDLLSRRQHSDETVGGYITELRALAQSTSLSSFVNQTNNTNAEEYILAAMLALGVKSRASQQRLLRETNISLQEFSNLASAAESAEVDQQAISGEKIGMVARKSRRSQV